MGSMLASAGIDFLPVSRFSVLGVVLVLGVARTAEAAAAAQAAAAWISTLVFGFLLWRHVRQGEPQRRRIDEPGFSIKIFLFSSFLKFDTRK